MENVRKCSTLISTAFMATQVNAGARRVIGKTILSLTLFLILGNITAARLHAQTAPEETDFGLCATYTNPEILEGPLSLASAHCRARSIHAFNSRLPSLYPE